MKPSVLITGCSSGIGYITALLLHQRGYQVFASARKTEDIERLAQDGLHSLYLDVTREDSIAAALETVFKQSDGHLHGLINNAGIGNFGALEDVDVSVMQQVFDTNVFGIQRLTQRVIPVMRKQGAGRIINISSVLGLVSFPYRGIYSASKFALEGLSDALRIELAGSNIYVSLIEPGPIETKFRTNTAERIDEYLDYTISPHKENYEKARRYYAKTKSKIPFCKPPEAVAKKIIHALECKRPKPRYFVTKPTYAFALLRRILSSRQMDWIVGHTK